MDPTEIMFCDRVADGYKYTCCNIIILNIMNIYTDINTKCNIIILNIMNIYNDINTKCLFKCEFCWEFFVLIKRLKKDIMVKLVAS